MKNNKEMCIPKGVYISLFFCSGKRTVGDAGPYKLRPHQSLPLRGHLFAAPLKPPPEGEVPNGVRQ